MKFLFDLFGADVKLYSFRHQPPKLIWILDENGIHTLATARDDWVKKCLKLLGTKKQKQERIQKLKCNHVTEIEQTSNFQDKYGNETVHNEQGFCCDRWNRIHCWGCRCRLGGQIVKKTTMTRESVMGEEDFRVFLGLNLRKTFTRCQFLSKHENAQTIEAFN